MNLINYTDDDINVCMVCNQIIKKEIWTCNMCNIQIDETCYDTEIDRCPNCNIKQHYDVENSIVDNKNVFIVSVDHSGNLINNINLGNNYITDNSGNIINQFGSITDDDGTVHDLSGETIYIVDDNGKCYMMVNGVYINTNIHIDNNNLDVSGSITNDNTSIMNDNTIVPYNNFTNNATNTTTYNTSYYVMAKNYNMLHIMNGLSILKYTY